MTTNNIGILPLGFLGTNCYIIKSDKGNAVLVDPGDGSDKVISYLNKHGLTAKYILLTHGHFDHIGAVNDLQKQTGATVVMHKDDTDIACDPKVRASLMRNLETVPPINPDKHIVDGDAITLDNLTFKVMHTPGHTKGGICYILDCVVPNTDVAYCGYIFSGDTLFAESIGRTDLYGGDFNTLIASLKRIAQLDGDYIVFPGHEEDTTLSHERKYNQYLGQGTTDYDNYF